MCNRMFPMATCGRILRIKLQTSFGKYSLHMCAPLCLLLLLLLLYLGTVEVFQAGLIDSNVIEDEAVIAGLGIGNLVLNHVFFCERRKKKKEEEEEEGAGTRRRRRCSRSRRIRRRRRKRSARDCAVSWSSVMVGFVLEFWGLATFFSVKEEEEEEEAGKGRDRRRRSKRVGEGAEQQE